MSLLNPNYWLILFIQFLSFKIARFHVWGSLQIIWHKIIQAIKTKLVLIITIFLVPAWFVYLKIINDFFASKLCSIQALGCKTWGSFTFYYANWFRGCWILTSYLWPKFRDKTLKKLQKRKKTAVGRYTIRKISIFRRNYLIHNIKEHIISYNFYLTHFLLR